MPSLPKLHNLSQAAIGMAAAKGNRANSYLILVAGNSTKQCYSIS